MLTIYGAYRSRATRNIWLLNEMGLPFSHVPVVQQARSGNPGMPEGILTTRSAEFLKVNPNGRIPAMKDGDLVLCESLAINLYIARKFGGSLAAANLVEDGLTTQWTLWAVTEVEPHAIQVLYNRVMRPVPERDEKAALVAIEALKAPLKVLDDALAQSEYLVGGRFTVADINVAECVRYCLGAPETIKDVPRVSAWLAQLHARPAYKAMMEKRNAEPA
jgi:glutathione S-transferase